MSDLIPEPVLLDPPPVPASEPDKAVDRKRRTTVSVTVSGDDFSWLEAEADRTGVSRPKLLVEYSREYSRLRDEMMGAAAGGYESSFLHAQLAGLETRISESLQQMQEQIVLLGFAVNVLMSQQDAKNKFDIATTPELTEAERSRAQALAPKRYESLAKATVRGITDDGRSVAMEKVVQDLDNRSSGDE